MNSEKTYMQLLLGGLEEKLEDDQNQQEKLSLQGSMGNLEADLRKKRKEYREKNKEKLLEIERKSRAKHRKRINQRAREYRQSNPERWQEIKKRYRKNNLEKARLADQKYYAEHRDVRRIQSSESSKRCRVRANKNKRNYRVKNGEKVREYFRNYLPVYRANQRKTNPQFLLAERMRTRLRNGLKNQGLKKTQRTEAMVGCTLSELRRHIESQFVNGMAWDKPETFAIDHIVPIVAFDLLDAEECKLAFNWKNLRPLNPIENKEKADKLPDLLPNWLPVHVREQLTRRMKQ